MPGRTCASTPTLGRPCHWHLNRAVPFAVSLVKAPIVSFFLPRGRSLRLPQIAAPPFSPKTETFPLRGALQHRHSSMEHGLLRGVNWAPNSSDEEDQNRDAMEESVAIAVDDLVDDSADVRYVLDSMTGESKVLDSQVADAVADEADVAVTLALLQLASTEVSIFEADKDIDKVSKLMLPVMFPKWYGDPPRDPMRLQLH